MSLDVDIAPVEAPADTLPFGGKLCVIFPAELMAVREALRQVVAALRAAKFIEEDLASVELVLAEVLNNVVLHAYAGSDDGMITVLVELQADGLMLRVEDDGAPMPPDGMPMGRPADASLDLLSQPEGGYGWFIIREVARDLRYVRVKSRNILTFRIAIHPLAQVH